MSKTNLYQYDFPQLIAQADTVLDHLNAIKLLKREECKHKSGDALAKLDGDVKLLISELDILKIRMKVYEHSVGEALGKRLRRERVRAIVQFFLRFNLKRMFKETREKVAKQAVTRLQGYITLDEIDET